MTDRATAFPLSSRMGDSVSTAGKMLPSRRFISSLVHGVLAEQPRLDAIIAKTAPTWPVPQLPTVDRTVLRMALWELLIERDVPVKAVINEAVELAKRFGGANSGRFVKANGKPLTNLLLTMADRMGAQGVTRFGDSTGRLEIV